MNRTSVQDNAASALGELATVRAAQVDTAGEQQLGSGHEHRCGEAEATADQGAAAAVRGRAPYPARIQLAQAKSTGGRSR